MNSAGVSTTHLGGSDQPARCPIPIWVSVALGCALRFFHLGFKPLWEDEGWTFQVAVSGRQLIELVGHDPHPYSYYGLYRLFAHWLTVSDWLFRFPSALASSLSLMLWPACLALTSMDRRIQKWSVVLMAVLPLNIQMGQEARAYAITQLFGMIVLVCYLWTRAGVFKRAESSCSLPVTRLGLLTIATALSCHIDGFGMAIPAVLFFHAVYEAAFVTPTQVHAKRSPSRFALPLALIIGGTCALPYLSWRALHLFGQGDVHALPSAPSPFSLLIQRLVAASPFGLSLKSVPFGLPPMLVMTCLAVVVAGGILASQFVPRSWIDRSMSVLFAIHLLLPLAAFFLMTLVTGTDMLEKRYFIMAVPGLVVLLTLGWLSAARFLPGIDFVLLLIVPLLVTVMWLRQGVARSSSDWRTLYSRIAPEIRPGDGFLHEAFINYPLYPLGPIRSYAYRAGFPIDEQRCADYHTTLTADEVSVSLLTASTWESDQERSRIEDFILNCPSSRVWTLSSDFSRMRMLDLSSRARLLKEFESPGVNAKLWRIESRRAASQYAQTPQAPRAPGAGGVR